MSTNANDLPTTSPPQTPTPTYYQTIAQQFLSGFAELTELIPDLEGSHPLTSTFVRTHLNVPRSFKEMAVFAVESHPTLQAIQKLDTTAARDKLQYIEAFRPVFEAVVAFGSKVGFTINSKDATLGADTLQIYAVCKSLARDAASPDMHALVKLLKKELGRHGRKRKGGDGEQQPAPAPAS